MPCMPRAVSGWLLPNRNLTLTIASMDRIGWKGSIFKANHRIACRASYFGSGYRMYIRRWLRR